jgi:hypothetical protein
MYVNPRHPQACRWPLAAWVLECHGTFRENSHEDSGRCIGIGLLCVRGEFGLDFRGGARTLQRHPSEDTETGAARRFAGGAGPARSRSTIMRL